MIRLELYVEGHQREHNGGDPELRWGWLLKVQDREIARSENLHPDPLNAWVEGNQGVINMLVALVHPEDVAEDPSSKGDPRR